MRKKVPLARSSRFMAVLWIAVAAAGLLWLECADRAPLREARKRQSQHKELRVDHWMAVGFRQAAWVSLVTGLAAVATVRWWGASRFHPGGTDRETRVVSRGVASGDTWFWIGISAAVALGAIYRLPKLKHSFWNDEAFAARTYVWGVKQPQVDGSLLFKPADWKTALFWNEKGNNHVWSSFEARVALKGWQRIVGKGANVFSEAPMRLPAFLWGLGAIAALGVLGRMMGGWLVGILCAVLLALHPWHVRFCEMRGYAAMLFALSCGLIFVLRALDDGRWRWWLGTAAMNLWAMLAFAGCVYFPLITSLLAAGQLWRRRDWTGLGRLVVANSFAAVIFFWCFAPSLPQLAAYLRSGAETGTYQITWGWYKDLWAALAAGVPWSASLVNIETQRIGIALAAVFLFSTLAGLAWMIRTGSRARFVALAFLGTTILTLAHNGLSRAPMVVWYLLPALLGAVMALAFYSGKLTVRSGTLGRLSTFIGAATLVFWIAGTAPIRKALAHTERQPMRQAAHHVSANAPNAITGIIGVSDRQMLLYDPRVTVLKTPAQLASLEAKAGALNKPLIIYLCGVTESKRRVPELVARLQGSDFSHRAAFNGLEEMFSYEIYERK
ncbi:MAG: hypothetical protein ACR2OZ_16280 [Verrucomicrobiales bacterium]